MGPSTADDPESRRQGYISQAEWRSRTRAMRKARAIRLASALALCVAGGLAYCCYRILSLDRLRDGVVSKLSSLDNYQVKIYRLSQFGSMDLWRTEFHRGNDWQVQLFHGQLAFTKLGEIYYCHTRSPNQTTTSRLWSGLKPFVLRLANQMNDLSFTMFFNPSRQLRLMREPDRKVVYRYALGDEHYEMTFDKTGNIPLELVVTAPSADGRGVVERADFSYELKPGVPWVSELAAPSAPDRPVSGIRLDHGNRLLIVAADANPHGDCFFEVKGLRSPMEPRSVRRLGKSFYDVRITRTGSDTWKLACMSLEGHVSSWPISLNVSIPTFNGIFTGMDSFEYKFSGPTCWLLPNSLRGFESDFDYLQYLYRRTAAREDFLENSYPDQNGVMQYDPEAAARMPLLIPVQEHQGEEAAADQTLIWLARELFDDSLPGLEERVQCWIDLGLLEKAKGDPDRARHAFEAAASLIRNHAELQKYEPYLTANASSVNITLSSSTS